MKLIRFSPHSTALMFSIVSLAASAGANTEIPTDTPAPTPSASPAPTPKVLTSFNGILGARYDASQTTGNSYKRLQDSVVFGFTITPAGVVDLVGLVQTGSAYGKRFGTVVDFNDHTKDQVSPTLYFKQIYLQRAFKAFNQNVVAQAGVIGSDQKIGTQNFLSPSTAIGTNGWIDGARMIVNSKIGAISVTGGSISDVKEADVAKRDRDFNYFEVQMSRKVFDKLIVEASGGKYDGEAFFRSAVEYDLQVATDHVVRLIQEGFYSREHFSYSTTASTDLGTLIDKKLAGRINIDLRFAHISPDAGFRGQAMNDISGKGNIFSVASYGKIDKSGKLNWFIAKDFMDAKRFQTGINWKFKGGNKK